MNKFNILPIRSIGPQQAHQSNIHIDEPDGEALSTSSYESKLVKWLIEDKFKERYHFIEHAIEHGLSSSPYQKVGQELINQNDLHILCVYFEQIEANLKTIDLKRTHELIHQTKVFDPLASTLLADFSNFSIRFKYQTEQNMGWQFLLQNKITPIVPDFIWWHNLNAANSLNRFGLGFKNMIKMRLHFAIMDEINHTQSVLRSESNRYFINTLDICKDFFDYQSLLITSQKALGRYFSKSMVKNYQLIWEAMACILGTDAQKAPSIPSQTLKVLIDSLFDEYQLSVESQSSDEWRGWYKNKGEYKVHELFHPLWMTSVRKYLFGKKGSEILSGKRFGLSLLPLLTSPIIFTSSMFKWMFNKIHLTFSTRDRERNSDYQLEACESQY